MNTENPTTDTATRTHTGAEYQRLNRINKIASAITTTVAFAPMAFIADGGERAERLATRLDDRAQRESFQRAGQILEDLADVLRDGHIHAQAATHTARIIRDNHAGDFQEGRTRGYAEALTAVEAATLALAGIKPGNTRQENAHAFAETIINGATNGIGAGQ